MSECIPGIGKIVLMKSEAASIMPLVVLAVIGQSKECCFDRIRVAE